MAINYGHCNECGILLFPKTRSKCYVECHPCGAKTCSRRCWADHRKDCEAVEAAKGRRTN